MIYFTAYAEKKFDILNKHKVYFRKEQIEDVIKLPDKIRKKGKKIFAQKDGITVIYQMDGEMIKVLTFYPVKNL